MSAHTTPSPRARPGLPTLAGPLFAAVLLLAVAACAGRGGAGGGTGEPSAPLPPAERSDPAPPADTTASAPPAAASARVPSGDILAAGLAALDSSDHATALDRLERVRERCGPSPAGSRAALVAAALHLDPRNSASDPQAAADRAARYLRAGVGPAWTGPVARVLYLEALEKGAEPPDGLGLDPDAPRAAADTGVAPPGCRSPSPPAELTPTRILPSLPGSALAVRLDRLQRRIVALQEELERIRAVLEEP